MNVTWYKFNVHTKEIKEVAVEWVSKSRKQIQLTSGRRHDTRKDLISGYCGSREEAQSKIDRYHNDLLIK